MVVIAATSIGGSALVTGLRQGLVVPVLRGEDDVDGIGVRARGVPGLGRTLLVLLGHPSTSAAG